MTDAAEAGMVHLRLIAGAEEALRVLRVLENSPAVASLVRIAGSAVRPPGDGGHRPGGMGPVRYRAGNPPEKEVWRRSFT